MENAPLLAADTLILNVELGPDPVILRIPPPHQSRTSGGRTPAGGGAAPQAPADDLNLPLPDFIRVRVSGGNYHCDTSADYTVKVVPFYDYVRHVLPNEWRDDYAESTRAGAVAVKSYAWYWIDRGGKWPDADVWDSTCDQVYNPAIEFGSTNAAVAHTWNWRLTKYGSLFQTSYRALESQCGTRVNCIGQAEADQMAKNGSTWDEILFHFYEDSSLTPVTPPPAAGYSLRFFGNGNGTKDRVLIPVGSPASPSPNPAVDVGAKDFTIEWWMKAHRSDNPAPLAPVPCSQQNWIFGNILLDRHRAAGQRIYGVSLLSGKAAFGVTGTDQGSGAPSATICSTTVVADSRWHHVVVQRRRSDGRLQLFIDGVLEASVQGPQGDISYPDGASFQDPSDPYLVIGASKRDQVVQGQPVIHPSFNGWLDDVRITGQLRYQGPFQVPDAPLAKETDTIALYALNEGYGNLLNDSAGTGLHPGTRLYGGGINGPEWWLSDLFLDESVFLAVVRR